LGDREKIFLKWKERTDPFSGGKDLCYSSGKPVDRGKKLSVVQQPIYLAIIGAGNAPPEVYSTAAALGKEAALKGWIVVTGGLGGVMEAAAKGAREAGGLTLGILPGGDRHEANPYIDIAVATHTHHARNAIIAQTADALIAVDGEYGTLSEVALGLKLGKPVVGLKTAWTIPGLIHATDPKDAVEQVSGILESKNRTPPLPR
jgi:hypothetical protein